MVAPQLNFAKAMVVGRGARLQLPQQLKRLGYSRVLLVTDQYLMASGVICDVQRRLDDEHIESSVYSEVQPDPTVENVNGGLKQFQRTGAQAVVGIGGGSPMDAAKAISILTSNPPPLSQYMGYHKIPHAGCPLVLIPTTAGTGSEATKVAVITDEERNIKMMLLDAHLQADIALVDFELSVTMPPKLTAHVGIDTLSHGLEAYVSRRANSLTDPIALSCIRLSGKYLGRAVSDGQDLEAREAMMAAALQGGIAFSNSSVCLIHGMSRPLGVHFHLTHGLSNALLLPAVTQFSIDAATSRYADVARCLETAPFGAGDQEAAQSLVPWLEGLNRQCEIPPMRDLVANRLEFDGRLEAMAEAALASGSPDNNPRVPTSAEIVEIYKSIW
jgi:alcohol dehydrogenase class IV